MSKIEIVPQQLKPRTQALSSMRGKDPGWGWSRASQIMGGKFLFTLGWGGRGVYCLCLKNCNCFLDSVDKIYICNTKLGMEDLFVYMTRLPVNNRVE